MMTAAVYYVVGYMNAFQTKSFVLQTTHAVAI